jgi:hypothetical protein
MIFKNFSAKKCRKHCRFWLKIRLHRYLHICPKIITLFFKKIFKYFSSENQSYRRKFWS